MLPAALSLPARLRRASAPRAAPLAPGWCYLLWIGGAMTLVAIVSGIAHVALTLRSTHEAVARAQAQQIEQVAARLDEELQSLRAELLQALAEVDATTADEGERRRLELYRLLRQQREIRRLVLVAPGGDIDARVDRLRPDRTEPWPHLIAQALTPAGDRAAQTRVLGTFFHKDVEPRAVMAARHPATGRYVLLAEFSLSPLSSALSGHVTELGGAARVLDAEGRVMAESARLPSRPTAAVHAAQPLSPTDPGPLDALALLGRLVIPPEAPRVVARTGELPALNGRLLVQVDEAVAFAPVARSLQAGLAVLVVTAAAAMAVSWLLARRISTPLRSIERAAFRIGRGAFDHRVDPAAHQELAPLAHALNDLAAQIGASHALLERRVQERTVALTAAKQAAERSDEAKSRFIAAASHDLRQPLHAVSILAALLVRRAPEGELRQLTLRLQSTVESLESFFVELLDISRLDMGQVSVSRQAVDLGALLHRMRDRFAGAASAGRLRVRAGRHGVDSDPVLLERIVQNLVSNALAHAGTGGVLVAARRHGDRVLLQVHDQGPGVPEDQRDRIFEEFVRLPRQNAPPGLGLGLSIVKRFSALLGHSVRVGRSPLGGACFSLELPRREPVAVADATHAPAATDLDGLFVLVVDDDPSVLEWTRSFLGACGCHTEGAASAAQARERLQAHLRDPDLILSDYHLACGGFDAVVALRDTLDPSIPIVLVTGDVQALRRPQPVLALAKPVSPSQLARAIAQAARRQGELTR